MRTIASNAETIEMAIDIAERESVRRAISKRRWRKRLPYALEWLNKEHVFQLLHGDAPLGKPFVMLGSEAHRRNRDYEDKFYKDHDPSARLYHLKWIGEPEEKQA